MPRSRPHAKPLGPIGVIACKSLRDVTVREGGREWLSSGARSDFLIKIPLQNDPVNSMEPSLDVERDDSNLCLRCIWAKEIVCTPNASMWTTMEGFNFFFLIKFRDQGGVRILRIDSEELNVVGL